MESLYVVFMRQLIRNISCSAILALTVAGGPAWASGRDQANNGIRALEAGRVEEAVLLLTEGIQSEQLPDEALAIAYHHRGIAHQRQGDTARAILDYTNAMQRGVLTPELRPRALNNRAICFELLGDLEAALRDLNRAIILRPDYADAYVNRASVLRKMASYPQAIQDYRRADALGHSRPLQIAYGVAQTLEAAGDRAQALAYYRRAASIDPSYRQALDRISALTQAPQVRIADASSGERHGASQPSAVAADAQPAASPEAAADSVLRSGILGSSAPITGSGFAQEVAPQTSRPARAPRPLAMTMGPKGGPETSELIPLLTGDPVVKILPPQPQGETPRAVTPNVKIAAAPPPAPTQVAAAQIHAAQLASYGSEAMARQGWSEISLRFAAELGASSARIEAAKHPRKGTVYRLFATGLAGSAESLCVRLKRRGQPCIPAILPPG